MFFKYQRKVRVCGKLTFCCVYVLLAIAKLLFFSLFIWCGNENFSLALTGKEATAKIQTSSYDAETTLLSPQVAIVSGGIESALTSPSPPGLYLI